MVSRSQWRCGGALCLPCVFCVPCAVPCAIAVLCCCAGGVGPAHGRPGFCEEVRPRPFDTTLLSRGASCCSACASMLLCAAGSGWRCKTTPALRQALLLSEDKRLLRATAAWTGWPCRRRPGTICGTAARAAPPPSPCNWPGCWMRTGAKGGSGRSVVQKAGTGRGRVLERRWRKTTSSGGLPQPGGAFAASWWALMRSAAPVCQNGPRPRMRVKPAVGPPRFVRYANAARRWWRNAPAVLRAMARSAPDCLARDGWT